MLSDDLQGMKSLENFSDKLLPISFSFIVRDDESASRAESFFLCEMFSLYYLSKSEIFKADKQDVYDRIELSIIIRYCSNYHLT